MINRDDPPSTGEQLLRSLHGSVSEIRQLVGETHSTVDILKEDVVDLKTRFRDMANHIVNISTRQAGIEATCHARSQSHDRHVAITRDLIEKLAVQITTQREDVEEKLQETTERLHVSNITGQVREVRLTTIWRTLAIIGGIIAAGGGLALAAVKLLR